MGFWDSLFGRNRPPTPEKLRELFFDAAERGDEATLAALATEHEAAVMEHFPEWQRVPEDVRRDPEKVQAYAHGLITVARYFAEARGRAELMRELGGRRDDNPLAEWKRSLEEADARMQACDYAGATDLLRAALERTERLMGSGVDTYLPITLGRLGTSLFQMGDVQNAVAPFDRALSLCEEQRDTDGVRAYLSSLYEVHRYRADAERAATCLERRADLREHAGDPTGAAHDRRQASIVRAGEPACRVVAQIGRELVEIDDVRAGATRVVFVFARNRISLQRASIAVEDGVARGEAGDLEGALAHFHRAAEIDRFDPWPSYHLGMTSLHLRRYREAMAAFTTTECLAPGWYHCRADRWLAEQLAAGAIDHASFDDIRGLIDGAAPPERALADARRALGRRELGVLHLAAGHALEKLGRRSEAELDYRSGLRIAEEPDIKTRLLTALGNCVTDPGEKTQYLGEAHALRGNLVAAATATVLLKSLASQAN